MQLQSPDVTQAPEPLDTERLTSRLATRDDIPALEPLMRDPTQAEALGRRARDRAVDDFGIDSEARAIAIFYEKVWDTR